MGQGMNGTVGEMIWGISRVVICFCRELIEEVFPMGQQRGLGLSDLIPKCREIPEKLLGNVSKRWGRELHHQFNELFRTIDWDNFEG